MMLPFDYDTSFWDIKSGSRFAQLNNNNNVLCESNGLLISCKLKLLVTVKSAFFTAVNDQASRNVSGRDVHRDQLHLGQMY